MSAIPKELTPRPLVCGIFPQTLVATPRGWRQAAQLAPGLALLTVGAGPVRLMAVKAQPPPLWCQHLPQGACGNRVPMTLPPGQAILIEAEASSVPDTAPYALIPAEALDGWRGIVARPNAAAPLRLVLERADLIYVGPGLILSCPGQDPPAEERAPCSADALGLAEARALVARLMAEDVGLALAQAALRGAKRA